MHKDSNNEHTDHLTEQIITDDSKIRKTLAKGKLNEGNQSVSITGKLFLVL